MPPLRLAAWAGLLLAAAFFLTTGGTYPGIASIDAHVIGQVVGIVVLGGWCALALVRPAWRPSTPLLVPIALASGAYVLSFLFSQRPRLSLEPTIAGLGWALAFVFLSRLVTSEWFRARVAVLMTAFTAVVAFGYIGQVLVEWWNWWGLVGRFAVPPLRPSFVALWLGSPNLIGTALVLLAPLVVAIAWTRYRRRSIAVVLALAAALATFLCGSRGAWLGVGVGAILALVLAATRGAGLRGSIAAGLERARRRPILLVPVAALAAGGLLFAPSVLQRLEQGGATLRLDLWRSALTIFSEHPILGGGPGTWVQLKVAANPAGVPNLIFPHAHDMYVQAAAELGVVGLLAGAALVLAVLRRLWSGWRSTDRSLSLESGAVLVSLAAFAAQSIVDNLSNLPFIILIVIATVAWVDGGLARSEPVRQQGDRRIALPWLRSIERGAAVPAIGLLAIVVAVPTLLRVDRAAALAREGGDAALQGHWGIALDRYDAAMTADPGFTLYEIQAAGALARVGRTAEARDLLAHAVESDPVAINVIGLAALEAELGDREAALAHVALARALGVGEPVVALNAGLIAERLGERDLALDAFADAIAWDPPLAGSPFWGSPVRVVPITTVLSTARMRTEDPERALILAYGGRSSDARVELEMQPPSPRRDVYIAATAWLSRDLVIADAELRELLRLDPSDWFAAAWAARIAHATGDEPTSQQFAAWAKAVQGDSAPGVIAERSAVPAAFDAPTSNLPGNYPWASYLRPVGPYLAMPDLTLIGIR